MSLSSRLDRLIHLLAETDVDAMLLSSPQSMGYFFGFFEDAHERLMTLAVSSRGDVRLIAPALSVNQASKSGIQDIRGWRDGESPLAHVEQLSDDWDLRTAVVAVESSMRADILLQLQSAIPSAMFHPAGPLLGQIMAVKDREEIQRLKNAGALVEDVFHRILPTLGPDQSEAEIASRLQQEVLQAGGALNFCLVATGAASAEPHHISDQTQVKPGDVLLLDFGCILDGYHADITRMVSIGKATEEVNRVYAAVRGAHLASRDAVRPGAIASEVDAAGRRVIADAGFGEFFTHRTGHGIGLSGHEPPYISSDNPTPLAIGHCFSIEPGIYLPGQFGIRLENIYSCSETGAESINEKEFEEYILEL